MVKKRKKNVRTRGRAGTTARPLHEIRFSGESSRYRAARNGLLKDEMELRAQLEKVSSRRRQLPVGGAIPEDYVFDELAADGVVRKVRMSDLFGSGKNTLILY